MGSAVRLSYGKRDVIMTRFPDITSSQLQRKHVLEARGPSIKAEHQSTLKTHRARLEEKIKKEVTPGNLLKQITGAQESSATPTVRLLTENSLYRQLDTVKSTL